MLLQGKRAVVTGGGQGIGRGIVEAFLDQGASVVILQRSAPPAELAERFGVHVVAVDLSDAAAIRPALDTAADALGGIDVVVNNAGLMFERGVEDITPQEWDAMLALNLRAPLFVAQAALPHLRTAGGGSIVNIGSIEGLGTNPFHAAYSASKAGLHGLTRSLAVDLGADGVRCNAIAPGWIQTELSADYIQGMPDPATARRSLGALHPVGRLGVAADVGGAAVFLASELSGFVTGETLVVDGGRTVKLPLPEAATP